MQDGSLLLPAQVGSKNLAPLYDKVNFLLNIFYHFKPDCLTNKIIFGYYLFQI